MSSYNIIETEQELNECKNCAIFTFDGEIHLVKVIKCYDGDTIHCIFKCNNKYSIFNVRMYGYDSAEMKPSKSIPEPQRSEIKRNAVKAKEKLEELILNKNVYLFCKGFDKYGRILGIIKTNIDDNKSINDIVIEEGYGYVYYGGTKDDQS